jgi:hypothetical protein
LPAAVTYHQGYRIAVYSPNDHFAVITAPGSNAVLQLGDRSPRATIVEGSTVCLDRALKLIEELSQV